MCSAMVKMGNTTEYWLFGNSSVPFVASYSPKPCSCDLYQKLAVIILSLILLFLCIVKIYSTKKGLNLQKFYKTYAQLMQTDGKPSENV